MLPQDPYMLLSIINMKLRDEYLTLDELCRSQSVDRDDLLRRLHDAGFGYDADSNQFTSL